MFAVVGSLRHHFFLCSARALSSDLRDVRDQKDKTKGTLMTKSRIEELKYCVNIASPGRYSNYLFHPMEVNHHKIRISCTQGLVLSSNFELLLS